MVTDGFEQYYKLGRTFLSPWNDVGKTVLEICRRANQGTLEIAEENLTRTADQLKRFNTVKRPEEFLNLQKECLNENITAWMGDIQKLINLSLGSFEEMNKSFTTNLKEQQQTTTAYSSGTTRGTEKGERK